MGRGGVIGENKEREMCKWGRSVCVKVNLVRIVCVCEVVLLW